MYGGNSVAIQSDGKIVVAGVSYNGTNYDSAVARYLGAYTLPSIIEPTALSDFQSEITIYPNPTNHGIFTVADLQGFENLAGLAGGPVFLTRAYVQNLLGAVVFEKEFNTSVATLLDLSKQSPEIYFLHLRNEVNVVVRKIVFAR